MAQQRITSIVPDVELFLALAPEELAPILLRIASQRLRNGQFVPRDAVNLLSELGSVDYLASPYGRKEDEVQLALSEAWNWLNVHGLIVPGRDPPWMRISRTGARVLTDDPELLSFRDAAAFPKSMLHPLIADRVWIALSRGDLSDAVFFAFRTVEEEVRKAGRFSVTDIGMPLMRKAFDKDTGPLTDKSQPEAEREALAHLFAGAVGSYKNPHSHRTVTITDPREAQEMTMLASHLLRIVDARPR